MLEGDRGTAPVTWLLLLAPPPCRPPALVLLAPSWGDADDGRLAADVAALLSWVSWADSWAIWAARSAPSAGLQGSAAGTRGGGGWRGGGGRGVSGGRAGGRAAALTPAVREGGGGRGGRKSAAPTEAAVVDGLHANKRTSPGRSSGFSCWGRVAT